MACLEPPAQVEDKFPLKHDSWELGSGAPATLAAPHRIMGAGVEVYLSSLLTCGDVWLAIIATLFVLHILHTSANKAGHPQSGLAFS
mmetsp:Transcript_6400/g.13991  ORF Transcript_6400/g.13991 Transcript_6400/m.13991 type:complete len:87 (-) Transcript_6400:70-330(-)